MISISQLYNLVDAHKEFSISWVSVEGKIISVPSATCTSFHGKGDSLNIMVLTSEEFRTINKYSIISFKGEEVAL